MSIMDPTGDKGECESEKSGLATHENVAMNTVSMNAISTASPFQQHPPPSPLSGCYLLVVLPEPHTAQHKDLIINRLAKGFLSWNKDTCHVDLTKELQALVTQSPEGEEARNGERLIQYATENLVTEILIHPQTNTLLQCIRNLLASFTKHRHIIHAGYTFSENGSWILQDGTFSFADFLDAFNEHDVQRVLRAYENSVTVDINCAAIGDWSEQRLSKEPYTRSCRIRLNPDDVLTAGMPAITSFTNYISQYLVAQELDELMQPSDVVGNIRFSHPTLYVFPGGQGDAALFGINGFNMLVDGGFARKSCFWDFTRHLDRLDAVLFTRLNNSNVGGMSSVLKKKREVNVYPQIGHFFCNLVERKHSNSPDGDKDLDPLILRLIDLGQEMMNNLKHINLQPHTCYRDHEPINLYHKVGHGTLDMYVLSPTKDCREVKEFLAKWNATDEKLFAGSHKKDANNMTFPIQNLISICALLVWQPANPDDTITRILFPGSAPQHKIFEGLQRLKNLEFLNHPTCTAKSISPSASLATLKDKSLKQKLSSSDKDLKRVVETKKQKRELVDIKKADSVQQQQQQPLITKTKKMSALENKRLDEGKDYPKIITDIKKNEKMLKDSRKEPKKDVPKIDKETEVKKSDAIKSRTDIEKVAMPKPQKSKIERKKRENKEMAKLTVKAPKNEFKSDNSTDQTIKTTTPKKAMNVLTSKLETPKGLASKTIHKQTVKTTPLPPPAKSAKDANNRKVLEQKNIEKMSSSGLTSQNLKTLSKPKAALPPVQTEKKAVVRRTKPATSPSKTRSAGSPAKSSKTVPISIKSEKDAVIKKIKNEKGTAESSTVSTTSTIETDATKFVDKCLTEKSEDMSLDSIESKVLADLKEERQVVEEIEAVLQKAERIECVTMSNEFEGEDETTETNYKKEEDMTEDDVTADIDDVPKKESTSRKPSQEFTEEDEYLIIEKEEVYTESSAHSGEIEHKHILDAAQSEKDEFVQKSHMKREDMNYKVTVKHAPGEEEAEEENVVEEDEEEEDDDEDEDEEEEVEVEVEIDEEDNEDDEKRDIGEIDEEEEEYDGEDQKDGYGDEKDVEKGIGEEQEKTDEPENVTLTRSEKELRDIDTDECVIDNAEYPESLQPSMKENITFAAGISQKTEEKDDSGKKDGEDITKEVSSVTPEKLDSSEKKTTDTDTKPELDSKEPFPREKLEESQERISTIESGATTTAPTLPEDERIPIEPIKPHTVEKQVIADNSKQVKNVTKAEIIPLTTGSSEIKSDTKVFVARQSVQTVPRDIVKTPDEVADLPVHEEVDPTLYEMDEFDKSKQGKVTEQKDLKEQKGVFGFFGKVANKFEKGMDKLTGKSRQDSEKDIDEKSSSKSASPKETAEIVSVVPRTGLKDEQDNGAEETKKQGLTYPLKTELRDSETGKNETLAYEDVEEVEALLEEASKKFKTVKDSLRDSLESLEDRIIDEELQIIETEPADETDEIKGTLDEVVEKLSEIKLVSPQSHESEKEDLEKEVCSVRDVKEAMRDVGEVLAGTAGIVIENKPKDVIEIVKKVAEVLKADDFLSEPTLSIAEPTQHKSGGALIEAIPIDGIHKVGTLTDAAIDNEQKKGSNESECNESPCTKIMQHTESDHVYSSERDDGDDKAEAKLICLDLMKDDGVENQTLRDVTLSDKMDVIKVGTEHVCQKVDVHEKHDDVEELFTETPEITFQQKSRATTAELVMLTPDSLPASPKLPEEGLRDKAEVEDTRELYKFEVPAVVMDLINQAEDIHDIIEKLILVEKIKITTTILEYIIKVRYISRNQIIQIIEQIMLENKIPVDTDILTLRTDESSANERAKIEQYIDDQYIKKTIKITSEKLQEISKERSAPIWVVIEVIQQIIRRMKVPENSILQISDDELQELLRLKDEKIDNKTITPIDKSHDEILGSQSMCLTPIGVWKSQLENEIMTECIGKGQKITRTFIDNFITRSHITRSRTIELIEEIIIEKRIRKHEIVDIPVDIWNELKSDDYTEIDAKVTKDSSNNDLTKEVLDIPSEDVVQKIGSPQQMTETIEKVLTDDFEAVEQEYKLDIGIHENKARSEVEEAMEDDINDAVEADEKIIEMSSKKVDRESVGVLIADKPLEVTEETIAPYEPTDFPTKSEQEAKESGAGKTQETVCSDTVEHGTGVTEDDEDEKVTTVKRMVVTATSEDGGEETELCTSESIAFTKVEISDSLYANSSAKEATVGATVHSRASTPDADSLSRKSSPGIEKDFPTLDDGDVRKKDATEHIAGISVGNEQFLPPNVTNQIVTDIKIETVQELPKLPVDVPQSTDISFAKKILEPPSSVLDDDIITEQPPEEHNGVDTVEKQMSISEEKKDQVESENQFDVMIDHTISSNIISSTQSKVEPMYEKDSFSVATDPTSIQEDNATHTEAPQSDELRTTPQKSGAIAMNLEDRSQISDVEHAKHSASLQDISNVGDKTVEHIPSDVEHIEVTPTTEMFCESPARDGDAVKEEVIIEKMPNLITEDKPELSAPSSPSQSEIHRDSISNEEDKPRSSTHQIQSLMLNKTDRADTFKDVTEMVTTNINADEHMSIAPSSVSRTPSPDKNKILENVKSPSLAPDLHTLTSSTTEHTEIGEYVSDQKSTSSDADRNKSPVPSPEPQSASSNKSIIVEDDESPNSYLELPNQTLNKTDATEMYATEVPKEHIHSTQDEDKSTVPPSVSPSSGRKESIINEEIHDEETTNVDQNAPSAPTLVCQSPDRVDDIIAEKDQSSTLSPKLDSYSASKTEDTEMEKDMIDEKSITPTMNLVESKIPSGSCSPHRENSAPGTRDISLSPASNQADEIATAEQSTHEKSASETPDQIQVTESLSPTRSPSRDSSIINEKDKSPSIIHDLYVPTSHEAEDMEIEEKVNDKKSPTSTTNKAQSTTPSPKSRSPSREDLATCIVSQEKRPSQSLISDSCSSAATKVDVMTIEEQKLADNTASPKTEDVVSSESFSVAESLHQKDDGISEKKESLSPMPILTSFTASKVGAMETDGKVIDQQSTSPTMDRVKSTGLSPVTLSPSHELNRFTEEDKPLSQIQDVSQATPSKPDDTKTKEEISNQTLTSHDTDQTEPTVLLPETQSPSHEEDIASGKDKSPSLPHDLNGATLSKHDDKETEKKTIHQTSTSPSKDQSESMVVLPVAQSPVREEKICYGDEKTPSFPHDSSQATQNQPYEMKTDEDVINQTSNGVTMNQIDSIIHSPKTKSPSHEDHICSVKDEFSSPPHKAYETTPSEPDNMKTDKEITNQTSSSTTKDNIKLAAPSSDTQLPIHQDDKTAGDNTVVANQDESVTLSSATQSPGQEDEFIDIEKNKEVVDKSISSVLDRVDPTEQSPRTESHLKESNMCEKDDSPNHDLRSTTPREADDSREELFEEKLTLSSSQEENIISEGDKSPSHSSDTCRSIPSKTDDILGDPQVIKKNFPSHPEDQVQSVIHSSTVQSPSRKESVISTSSEALKPISDTCGKTSETDSTDGHAEIVPKKSISLTADQIDTTVPAAASSSPSRQESISRIKEKSPEPAQESCSPTHSQRDDINIELSNVKSIGLAMDQDKSVVSSPGTKSPSRKESAINEKDESETLGGAILRKTEDKAIINEAVDEKSPSSIVDGKDSLVSPLSSQSSSHEREISNVNGQSPSLTEQTFSSKLSITTDTVGAKEVIHEELTGLSVIENESLSPSISPLSPSRKKSEISENNEFLTRVGSTSDRTPDTTEDNNLKDLSTAPKCSDNDGESLISSLGTSPEKHQGSTSSLKNDFPDSKIITSLTLDEKDILTEEKDPVGHVDDDIHTVKLSSSPHMISTPKEDSTIDYNNDDDMKCQTPSFFTPPLESISTKMGAIHDEVSNYEKQINQQLSETTFRQDLQSSPVQQMQPSTSLPDTIPPKISNIPTPTLATTGIADTKSGSSSPNVSTPLPKDEYSVSPDTAIGSSSDTYTATPQVHKQEFIDISKVSDRTLPDEKNKENDTIIDTRPSTLTSITTITRENETIVSDLLKSSSKQLEDEYVDSHPTSTEVDTRNSGDSFSTVTTELDGANKAEELPPSKDVPSRDRSRSHSLFETDERTSLGRSRAASVFEDKEEIISSESRIDPQNYNQAPEIHDEHLELEKKSVKSGEYHEVTPAKRTDIEHYIVSQYVTRKRKITSDGFEEIVALYDIPNSIVIEIIREICTKKNIDEESILDYDDDDNKLESKCDTMKNDFKLNRVSFVKRLDIEDYIDEVYIKTKRKISLNIIPEMAASKEVSDDVIFAIIENLIVGRNIPKQTLVEDEVWTKIQADSTQHTYIASEGETEEDDNRGDEQKEEDHDFNLHHNIGKSGMISEKRRIDIEMYVMENYVQKGQRISSSGLNDIENAMSVPRWILLEIITKIVEKMKLPRESIYDEKVHSEITFKDHASERLSGKSSPEHESSGYSTPEVRRYDDKFESQFHKAFVGGMTEIRTTHITTLSGKSTPDVGTRVDTPESLSELPMTVSAAPLLESHIIEEKSEPIIIECAIPTTDSPEYETVIQTKTIKCTVVRQEGDDSTGEKDGNDILNSSIQRRSINEPDDQYELETTAAAAQKGHEDSLMLDNKSVGFTPDRTKDGSDFRAHTGTPEGFRTGEIIKTTITTTRTMSEEGEIITTTKEVTETTNEKGETIVTTRKVDVSVADHAPAATELSSIDTTKLSDTCRQSISPGSEAISPQSDLDSTSHGRATAHLYISTEEKHVDTDDEGMGSPMSISSQVSRYEKHDEPVQFSTADMSSSFYGHLPDVPPTRISDTSMTYSDDGKTDDFTFKKQMPDNRMDVMSSSKLLESSDSDVTKVDKYQDVSKTDEDDDTSHRDAGSSSSKDPLREWGTPLKLPPPERPEKFNLRSVAMIRTVDISPDSLDFDVIHDWGEPMRLPSPTQIAADDIMTNKIPPAALKKDTKQPRKVISENLKNKKSSESPIRSDKKIRESKNKVQPVYLDLTYVPHHGNSYYASLEFFKRVRARYYVFSGTEPSRDVYDALLHAKKTWENKNLEVTIIPTYDTDTLGYWVADNEEALAANHIDLSPSASRCTINLQDHETSCSAYRLEF